LPPSCSSLGQSPQTSQVFAQAVQHVELCLRDGCLLSSQEAMALACGEARVMETLYSIARRFAQDEDVDLLDLLSDLERKYPDFV
jgi:hypothetical protein